MRTHYDKIINQDFVLTISTFMMLVACCHVESTQNKTSIPLQPSIVVPLLVNLAFNLAVHWSVVSDSWKNRELHNHRPAMLETGYVSPLTQNESIISVDALVLCMYILV